MSMAIVMAGNDVRAHDDVSALDAGMGIPSRTLILLLSGLHILLLLICLFILIYAMVLAILRHCLRVITCYSSLGNTRNSSISIESFLLSMPCLPARKKNDISGNNHLKLRRSLEHNRALCS
ncbi:hypothetical protein ANAPH1_01000 [Anaplasma phagocytophilum]|nr:hypothetical protein ANAPH1_01000 [Anaplasma phagocytophilum]